jgi:hypothetical protein
MRREIEPWENGESIPSHLRFVRTLPCVICATRPVEAAHIRFGDFDAGKAQALAKKPSDRWVLPLCAHHHREGGGAQHQMNERAFWQRHGIDPLDLARRLFVVSGDHAEGERICNQSRRLSCF